jgi:Mce-associated membrane protein
MSPRLSPRRLWALALVLVVAGAVLQGLTWQARGAPASDDHALTDTETTNVVLGQVSEGLTRIFTYTPAETQATERAAAEVLDGQALGQYQALFGQVKQQAPGQGLTLTTRVSRAGVVELTGDTARVLVFLDQTIGRKDQQRPSYAAAQLSVTARLEHGQWRIVQIHSR